MVILNGMIQLAPRHLPLKWCDSTWDCGDLGLITHLWGEGGVNICASLQPPTSWCFMVPLTSVYEYFSWVFRPSCELLISLRQSWFSSLTRRIFHLALHRAAWEEGGSLICALAVMKPLAEAHTVSTQTHKVITDTRDKSHKPIHCFYRQFFL